jgi:site-specific DNA-cytosine methylase
MRILVACEESQAVTIELRNLGHEAYSCDIIECSGGHPEWHIMQDVLPLLNPKDHPIWDGNTTIKGIEFKTCDGKEHFVYDKWDMIIAFPPCTHLCSAGQHWFSRGLKDPCLRDEAVEFFMALVNADCDKIAIENPVGIMSTRYRKPDCKVHPWQFGHPESKNTCLWTKNLPALIPTDILEKPEGGWKNQHFTNGRYSSFVNYDEQGKVLAWNDPRTAKIRSKTYPGIAKAMAEQWAGANE